MNYLNSNYNTPFWNYAKKHFIKNISKSLKFRMNYLNTTLYDSLFHNPLSLFDDHSWYYTLIQFTNLIPPTQSLPSNIDTKEYLKNLQKALY